RAQQCPGVGLQERKERAGSHDAGRESGRQHHASGRWRRRRTGHRSAEDTHRGQFQPDATRERCSQGGACNAAEPPDMPGPAEVPPERHELLAKIASLYYEVGLTQSEIAKRFGISRSGVSRLLAEARETGVVNISVRWPNSVPDDLSTQLARHYPDTEVRVVGRGGRGYSQIIEALGAVAAGVLEEKLQDHNILGISWNTGVRSEEHTSELQSRENLVCRLLLEKKNVLVLL